MNTLFRITPLLALATIGLLGMILGGCRSRDYDDRNGDDKPWTQRDEPADRSGRDVHGATPGPFADDDAMRDGDFRDGDWRVFDECRCTDAYECVCCGHDHIDHYKPIDRRTP